MFETEMPEYQLLSSFPSLGESVVANTTMARLANRSLQYALTLPMFLLRPQRSTNLVGKALRWGS